MRNKLSLLINLSLICISSNLNTKQSPYYSQYGQDKFVHETFFMNKHDGIFVEIGALDGITISNTYFFEKNLGWKGICFEPNPRQYTSLKKNRKCICLDCCISNFTGTSKFLLISGPTEPLSGIIEYYHPKHLERIEREVALFGGNIETIDVECYPLNDILIKYNISHIDYLSIDTEGSELQILESIDFDNFQIDVISVEVNYENASAKDLLTSKGYKFVKNIYGDEIYVKDKQ